MTYILETAEPFLLTGGRAGCLLIHGFTGAPTEMRWMGDYLYQRGLTCLGIRLSGHATSPEDMRRSRWSDWCASVEDGYHLLRGLVDRIYLVGLSMGGVLSLLMASRLEVRGVVAMSTPYQLPREYPLWVLRLYGLFYRYARKTNEPPGSSWFDKDAYASQVSYPQNPTRSIIELKSLLGAMRAALPAVRAPVLLIHSRDDRYVLLKNIDEVFAALTNVKDKTKLLVTGSGHVLTRDAARRQIFAAAWEFIQRLENQIES